MNYISARPTDEFGGYFKVGYAEYEQTTVEAVVSGDADASDNAMRTHLMHEIEIILRALHPAIGDSMDVQSLEPVA